jgi:AraC family transcriptional regulator
MTSPRSRAEYDGRMHRVLEHIDRQLDQPLDLETLADVAHFSPFHFHRLFSAWMGETLGDYLRRRRVEIAAMRLVAQPRIPVLQLALSVGFGSAEAFARAFKKRFGCPPTLWRVQQSALRSAKSNPGQMERNIGQILPPNLAKNDAPQLSAEASMKVELIDRQRTAVAYLRHVGPYGAPIAAFWQSTVYPWMATSGLLQQPRYGISHDDPTITAPQQCRYDAGCEIPPTLTTLGNALKTTIPGGKYAALSFKGTVADIEQAWTAMLRDWLPSSGLQLDGRMMFEYYPQGSSYDPATGVFDCKLCIPVAPLSSM